MYQTLSMSLQTWQVSDMEEVGTDPGTVVSSLHLLKSRHIDTHQAEDCKKDMLLSWLQQKDSVSTNRSPLLWIVLRAALQRIGPECRSQLTGLQ